MAYPTSADFWQMHWRDDGKPMGEVNRNPGPEPEALAAQLSLDQIFRDNVQFVWRNARRLGCDESWVDDAVQEVFLVVARRINEFEHRSSLRTWLFAITYRVVQRMQRNRVSYFARLRRMLGGVDSHQPTLEADWELRRLLDRLSAPKRAVLILAELEGFSASEIARCLGLPLGTVHSRLRGARLDLKRWLDKSPPLCGGAT
jgi:RNA polymerase sigma-70 factor, ECF subfamily